MKKNTQKLLVFLHAAELVGALVELEMLVNLFPRLTEAGIRSSIYGLKNKQLLDARRVAGQTSFFLTDKGKRLLKTHFPALNEDWLTWKGEMECMVFLRPPATDPQFRYLRSLLLDERAFGLSRGVYLSPRVFSDVILHEVKKSYQDCIVLFQIGQWKISVESAEIISAYGIIDIVENYSGISNQINRMLSIKKLKKALKDGDKNDIFLVFDKIYDTLIEDPGFCAYYFPNLPTGPLLLQKFIELLSK